MTTKPSRMKVGIAWVLFIVFFLAFFGNAGYAISFLTLYGKYLYAIPILGILPFMFIMKHIIRQDRRNPHTGSTYDLTKLMQARQSLVVPLFLLCAGVHGWYMFHSPVDVKWFFTTAMLSLTVAGTVSLITIISNPSMAEAIEG